MEKNRLLQIFTLPSKKKLDQFDVKMSYVETPDDFYFHWCDVESKFEKMRDEMKEFYSDKLNADEFKVPYEWI